ncbi:MAG: 4Fe-4S dicluster domain-containing protein [Planctomycetota bacterium]|jgi:2-oxoglutarate ferredoxin oxidoreductase subunit delta
MSKIWRKPLDRGKVEVIRGKVHIIRDRCKGCGFCIELCPRDVLEFSEEFNVKGYHPPKAVRAERCLDCNLCEIICPEFAIFSVREGDEDDEAEGGSKRDAGGS